MNKSESTLDSINTTSINTTQSSGLKGSLKGVFINFMKVQN